MENVLSGQLGNVGFWRSYPQSAVDEAFRLLGRVGLDHMVDRRADALSGGQRLRAGQIVYDGPPKGLSDDRLTGIYGEEDWSGTSSDDDDDDALSHKQVTAAVDIPELQKIAQG